MQSERTRDQTGLGFAVTVWLCPAGTQSEVEATGSYWFGERRNTLIPCEHLKSSSVSYYCSPLGFVGAFLKPYSQNKIVSRLILYSFMNLERERLASILFQRTHMEAQILHIDLQTELTTLGKKDNSGLLHIQPSHRQKDGWMRWSMNANRKSITWITLD